MNVRNAQRNARHTPAVASNRMRFKKKKNETSPLMSATSITKQSAWICFTACVVVTSDTMSSTPEFQRDSVSDGWITGRPKFDNVRSCKILTEWSRHLLSAARVSALLAARLTTVSLDYDW